METCNRLELIRLPCDQGGNWNSRIDTTLILLAKIDRALRPKTPPPATAPYPPSGPPHPLVPFLEKLGISYSSLRPQRQLAVVAQIKQEYEHNICKLGPLHPPDGGWQGRVIAFQTAQLTMTSGQEALLLNLKQSPGLME